MARSTIRRGPQQLNRLHPSAIKVAQREPNLDAQMYDGRKSLVLFIEDLRVGDVLEVEYSVIGADPTLAGHVSWFLPIGTTSPVAHWHTRLVLPRGHLFSHAGHGPDRSPLRPHYHASPLGDEYVWDRVNLPAYAVDAHAPSWYFPLPIAEVSDFTAWAEVARWAAPLIQVPPSRSRALIDESRQLALKARSTLDYALLASRFVQDQIRYVALETGLSRRRASDPAQVLARRFGDCKDKSVLLAALLRIGGVEAYPALVSTAWRDHLRESLPSAAAFDHVIVRVRVDGQEFWIDPTLALQGGDLSRARYSPLGLALVLSPDTADLSPLPREPNDDRNSRITDRYVIPSAGSGEPAQLDVEREFSGGIAASMRATLSQQSREATTKDYLQIYARRFATIESLGPIEVHDDREHDRFVISAHYRIREPWTWSEPRRRWELEIRPTLIDAFLEKPEVAARTAPLAMSPIARAVRSVIELEMASDWVVKPEHTEIESPAFKFEFSSSGTGHHVRYQYDFVPLADHVAPADLRKHAIAVEQAERVLSRVLSWRPLAKGANPWAWLMLALAVVVSGLAAPRLWRYSPPAHAPLDLPPQPFTGWLAIVGLRVVVSPITNVVQLARGRWILTRAGWSAVADSATLNHGLLQALLALAELTAQTLFVAYGILVAATYFKRRSSFPHHFAAIAIGYVIYTAADDLAVGLLGVSAKLVTLLTQAVISGLFVRYVLTSPQAKRTFTQP